MKVCFEASSKEASRMDRSNIVSTQTVPGVQGLATPVGFVNTRFFTSTDAVLDEAVQMGNAFHADAIVLFHFQSQPSAIKGHRKWRGSGTAVKIE